MEANDMASFRKVNYMASAFILGQKETGGKERDDLELHTESPLSIRKYFCLKLTYSTSSDRTVSNSMFVDGKKSDYGGADVKNPEDAWFGNSEPIHKSKFCNPLQDYFK